MNLLHKPVPTVKAPIKPSTPKLNFQTSSGKTHLTRSKKTSLMKREFQKERRVR